MAEGVRIAAQEREAQAQAAAVPRDSRSLRGHALQRGLGNRVAQRMLARPPGPAGLPEPLRASIEALSGVAMDGVTVHRDSPRPAQMNALAFAHGAEIHLGPGQERHLPHEAWHVVQQMQGRARPSLEARGVQYGLDAGLEREADVMGERAAASVLTAPAGLARMRAVPVVQAKTQQQIARHGSFDIASARYRLLDREGCEIAIKFRLGTGIPPGTRVSFIQALKTIRTKTDDSIVNAQKVAAQATTDDHERVDQLGGNPSAYYLDYIDENLLPLIILAAQPEDQRGFDIRSYEAYRELYGPMVTRKAFNKFWTKYDEGRLDQLLTVQTDTSDPNIKMSQGKKLQPADITNLFNLFNSDVNAKIYDMPKDNLDPPKAIGEVSTCLFHTAAVTKVTHGDATVWDVIQWGYTITMTDEDTYVWELIDLQPIDFDETMIGAALAKMHEMTPNFVGPDQLVAAD
jgi:hypothetical protein